MAHKCSPLDGLVCHHWVLPLRGVSARRGLTVSDMRKSFKGVSPSQTQTEPRLWKYVAGTQGNSCVSLFLESTTLPDNFEKESLNKYRGTAFAKTRECGDSGLTTNKQRTKLSF